MCGLTGLLCPKTDKDIKSYLSKMTSSLVHRGPDDEGIWTEESIGMGHRRLSIIDLSSSGKQPMNSNCGRFVLTFNGEIYNHLDLRVELELRSLSWVVLTALDSEHVNAVVKVRVWWPNDCAIPVSETFVIT